MKGAYGVEVMGGGGGLCEGVEPGHPDSWYDSLLDSDVCDWLDSQT